MEIPEKEAKVMQKLAREGKFISRIQQENFPQYEYWDIYTCIYRLGERSSIGIKAMITTRLNQLLGLKKKNEREVLVQEIKELISGLYKRYRENQKKLEKIRELL